MFGITGIGPLLVFGVVIIVALLVCYVASRYGVANANEALIVAGSAGAKVRDEKGQLMTPAGDKGVKVVVGGGTFVMPLIHRVGRLKLTVRQIDVVLGDAVTSQGIKVKVQGVATFKIGRDVESLRNAAERFLDAKDEHVDSIVKNVLEGSLRSIVGRLTIEELIMDRQKLQQEVQDAAKGDLSSSGLQIDAFTIQSISDESGYVDLLGAQKLAVVEKDARIANAEAGAEAERLQGSAEAAVVLTKGEAEAKALAMRADAYKQFNDAAIIQTVLAALPDIVRAAAEPMEHIDSLTVMSVDGASEMVKNTTRVVAESATAIKGLTGLDVPNLIGNAMRSGALAGIRHGDGERGGNTKAAAAAPAEPAVSTPSSASAATPTTATNGQSTTPATMESA